jgi:uncharacterized membrane protein YjjP (DUF1212 family)
MDHPRDITTQDGDTTHRLLTEMPRALSTYGTPAHRLEEAMGLCATRLGAEAEYFALPTAVFASIGEGEDTRTHMVRVTPGDVNLEKLDRVDAVMGRLLRGQVGPREALADIETIRAAPNRYPASLAIACFGIAAGGAAQFFGGSWIDAAIAATLGLLVGLLAIFAQNHRDLARLTEFLAGVAIAAVAGLLGGRVTGLSPTVVIVSSLIVLFPGLTLTVAINELATKNLASGTARLMGGAMILLAIGFGVGVGQVAIAGFTRPPIEAAAMPPWTQAGAIILVPLALVVLFRARPRDTLVIIPAAAIGYYAARFGSIWAGPELGAGLGAFMVGIIGNLYARTSRRPTAITLVPGIMLLVPGAIGFASVSSFLARDAVQGLETAFTMLIAATGIVIGLLLANVLVRSKQSL